MIIGYTAGAFDLFHVGHVNLLRNSRERCDRLIVGVSTDDLVAATKGKTCVVPFKERSEIVGACRYADLVIPQTDLDKVAAWKTLRFNLLFIGDDWLGNVRWRGYERELAKRDVSVVYLPYTRETSSTLLTQALNRMSLAAAD
jgi:glycerol-3-phosphate cytidylyltransferase